MSWAKSPTTPLKVVAISQKAQIAHHLIRAHGWFKDQLFGQLFQNVGVLVSGNAVSSLFGLGYLALTTRALGARQFGVLVPLRSSLFLLHTCSPEGFSNKFIQAWLRGPA